MIKSKIPSEYEEQCAFIQWFHLQYPHIKIAAIHNGLRLSIGQAVKAKKSGSNPGIPDLLIPRRVSAGLNENVWIEFKRINGGRVSPDQKEWHEYLQEHSDDVVIVAYGCDDAVKKIRELNLV